MGVLLEGDGIIIPMPGRQGADRGPGSAQAMGLG